MNAKAIVYTSNTGYTAEYARLLGEKTGLPVYSYAEAKTAVEAGRGIIYLGWLMAGQVKGYPNAAKKFQIKAVCAVGMGACGTQLEEVRKANAIPKDIALFTLQGGFDLNRLHGIYGFMMRVMKNILGKKLAKKQDLTADEADMLDLLQNGGNRVCGKNLLSVLGWYESSKI